jgi:hypothetical protein
MFQTIKSPATVPGFSSSGYGFGLLEQTMSVLTLEFCLEFGWISETVESLKPNRLPCGSGGAAIRLAREEAVTFNINGD